MDRRRIDIGSGATLEAIVDGDRPVTVVFENGIAMPLEQWDYVATSVTPRARTLRYERRPASVRGRLSPRPAAVLAQDLDQLLTALALRPPYVIVGHSWGGVIARAFAHAHASQVAGLVFVDATHEVVDSPAMALVPLMYRAMTVLQRVPAVRRWMLRQLCPAAASDGYRTRVEQSLNNSAQWRAALRTARAEGAGIRHSLAVLRQAYPDLPPIPVHVLTAGGASSPNAAGVRRVHEAWRATVARAPTAQYTHVPDSDHAGLLMEAPDVVVSAILGVLDAVDAQRATAFFASM